MTRVERAWWLAEDARLAPAGQKRCRKCRSVRPHNGFHTDPGRPDGYYPWCHVCRQDYAKVRARLSEAERTRRREQRAEYRAALPEFKRRGISVGVLYSLRTRYGISPDEYFALCDKQQNLCAICHRSATDQPHHVLHVDHDHSTGAVRGLLCLQCNAGIGALGDDPDRLAAAISYLAKGTA